MSVRRFSGPKTDLVLTLQGDRVDPHGVIQIRAGGSNTVLVAEPGTASATCADMDGNGVAGLTGLDLDVRDVRSGEVGHVSVQPVAGELEEPGEALMTLTIGGRTLVEAVEVQF